MWLQEHVPLLFFGHTTPGNQVWFCPHLCLQATLWPLFPTQTRAGEGHGLLGLTCSVGLGIGRGIADTAGMYGECLLLQRSAGKCYSLRQVVHFPRGIGPQICVFWQCQPLQAPRKMWAVTLTFPQFSSHCGGHHTKLWGHRPQPHLTPHLWHLPRFCWWPARMPTSWLALCSWILFLPWHLHRWGPSVCKHAELEGPYNNDFFSLLLTQAFPWTPSAVLYQTPQNIFMAVNLNPLPEA